jgi:DNA-binding HxlR family transcriptional regulator
MSSIEKKPGCIKSALNIVGDKWTPLILSELSVSPVTFTELEQKLVGISPRTLSQRLEMLLGQTIVSKTSYCDHPPRYKYALTDKGQELKSVLIAMAEWGNKHYQEDSC